MTIAAQINDVIRRVDVNHRHQTVTLQQTFGTDVADLWDACTNPERLPRWFEPVEGDLRVGGRYRLTDSGTEGRIERCEAPSSLRISWEYDGDTSWVTVTITPTGTGEATLVLAHSGTNDDHWAEYGPAAGGVGWDESLLALTLHLAGEGRSIPEQMSQFGGTEEGRRFLTSSVAAWREAHEATGADPATASAAADRALKAYQTRSW